MSSRSACSPKSRCALDRAEDAEHLLDAMPRARARFPRSALQLRGRAASAQQAGRGASPSSIALLARGPRRSRLPQSARRRCCAASATTSRRSRFTTTLLRRASAAAEGLDELRPCAEDRRPRRARDRRLPPLHRARSGVRRGLLEPGEPEDVPLRRRRGRARCAMRSRAAISRRSTACTSISRWARRWRIAGDYAASFGHYATRQRAAAAHRFRTARTTRARGCSACARRYTRRVLPRARRRRLRRARSDLHRRPAARGLDADRADPVEPLRGRRHDGAAGHHLDHARAAPRRRRRTSRRLSRALARSSRDELRALGEQYLERTRIQRKTRPAVLHRQDAEQLRAHRPDPARSCRTRRSSTRAAIRSACCFSGFKQHFARGQNFTYASRTSAATTATTSS